MRLPAFVCLLGLAWTCLGAELAPGPLPDPIATRQTFFAVPFRIGPGVQPGSEPVEVQLHVSTDRGTHWQLYDRVDPRRGQFLFRAGGDGEYWFLIRTLDRAGQLRPERTDQPGLRVIVDTTPPKLQLTARRGEGGQIAAQWQVSELFPNPESLRIQYRTDQQPTWQMVAVDRPTRTDSGPIQTGQATWWPPAGTTRVEVRAETADRAGNPAVTHAQVALADAATPGALVAPAPPANAEPPLATQDLVGGWRRSAPQVPAPVGEPAASPPALPFPTSAAMAAPAAPAAPAPSGVAARTPQGTVAIQINPAIQRQYAPPGDTASGDTPAAPAQRPRMISSRAFELDYQVQSPGGPGFTRVELWGTRDGGRSWDRVATDEDGRSPMLVTVPEEGIYGFRFVIRRGGEADPAPPRSGEEPEMWIGVDQSKPLVRIVSAEPGAGPQAGQLVIRWQASDLMLAARPIALFFSETVGGPWAAIATGLDNTGVYPWPVDNRVPDRIYLRLEARDEAGNLGIAENPQPVAVDALRPTVEVREVRPIGGSAQRGPARYRFW